MPDEERYGGLNLTSILTVDELFSLVFEQLFASFRARLEVFQLLLVILHMHILSFSASVGCVHILASA